MCILRSLWFRQVQTRQNKSISYLIDAFSSLGSWMNWLWIKEVVEFSFQKYWWVFLKSHTTALWSLDTLDQCSDYAEAAEYQIVLWQRTGSEAIFKMDLTSGGPLRCDFCDQSFNSHHFLYQHCNQWHGEELKKFWIGCNKCSKFYPTAQSATAHAYEHKTHQEWWHQCKFCRQNNFSSKIGEKKFSTENG